MKTFTVVLIVACAALAAARPEEKYTDRYDNVNVSEITGNPRLFKPYVKCLLDEGKCSPDGKELKSHVKEALETYCQKCTETQKTKTREVIAHMINNEPEYWAQLTAKYDPDNKYASKYESELKKLSS